MSSLRDSKYKSCLCYNLFTPFGVLFQTCDICYNHFIPSGFEISECNQKRLDSANMKLNYFSYLNLLADKIKIKTF